MHERIKAIRQALGLTGAEFGRRIGITNASVSTMENGKSNPSEQTIRFICREFDVNETWLRTGEGNMFIQPSREQELSRYVGQLLADRPESFRSALITTLLRFDPNGPEWEILERIVRRCIDEMEKPPGD